MVFLDGTWFLLPDSVIPNLIPHAIPHAMSAVRSAAFWDVLSSRLIAFTVTAEDDKSHAESNVESNVTPVVESLGDVGDMMDIMGRPGRAEKGPLPKRKGDCPRERAAAGSP